MRNHPNEHAAMIFADTDAEIERCFPVLLVLRPHLRQDEFLTQVRRQMQQGYRMAYLEAEGDVISVAGFRVQEFLAWGRVLYIDDLITLPDARGHGHGGRLLDEIVAHAAEHGCDAVHLDSGYQRNDAHRLYLNHGFRLECHHFARSLPEAPRPQSRGRRSEMLNPFPASPFGKGSKRLPKN